MILIVVPVHISVFLCTKSFSIRKLVDIRKFGYAVMCLKFINARYGNVEREYWIIYGQIFKYNI